MHRQTISLIVIALLTAEYVQAQPPCPYTETDTITYNPGNAFGNAIDASGDAVVIGDFFDNTAYVYERDTAGNWEQTAELIPSVSGSNDWYGFSVAIGSERIVVGAPNFIPGGTAFVFDQQPDGSWIETDRLTVPAMSYYDDFGQSVDISDDDQEIIVGMPGWDLSGSTEDAGVIFVFERDQITGEWSETGLRTSISIKGLRFGYAVAFDDDVIAVGTRSTISDSLNSVYVFEKQSGVWSETAILQPGDGSSGLFSIHVDVSDDTIVASRATSDVFAFESDGSSWSQSQQISLGSAAYIRDVKIENDRLAIAHLNSPSTRVTAVYDRQLGAGSNPWNKTLDLEASDSGVFLSGQINSMAMTDEFILIGNATDNVVYLFDNRQTEFSICPSLPSGSVSNVLSMSIDVGPAYAGHAYWILGSTSGTAPGFDFNGVPIPLNSDPYFSQTSNLSGTPITNGIGILDVNGQAQAQLLVQPSPSLAGGVAHHTYVIANPFTGDIVAVGIPAAVQFRQ